jgi:molecular chaperone HtpG
LKEENQEKQNKVIRNLADLALLSQGLLKGNNLTSFIQRSVDLMQEDKKSRIILT